MTRPHSITVPNASVRRAFTLVELLVVIMIIAILSSLTLAGLSGVRQRAREDKTKSTIRKIDAVIRPMYDSYRTRRVRIDSTQFSNPRDAAIEKLRQLRVLMTREMPDSWLDVVDPATLPSPPLVTTSAAERRYVQHYLQLASSSPRFTQTNPGNGETFRDLFASAETLHMIVSLGGFEADALEFFRPDEIGDIDKDGALEFHDGWGRPLMFIRWPVGYPMPFSMATPGTLPLDTVPEEFATATDVVRVPDPMDPWKVTTTGTSGTPATFFDPALLPLIYSGGPDEALTDPLGTESGYGIRPTNTSWTAKLSPGNAVSSWKWSAYSGTTASDIPGTILNPSAAGDNITSFDLVSP
jgi:prepilin-type N-terminal cleavage/methylation domain-containing protein